MMKNKDTESICYLILQLDIGKSKALANLIMGQVSQQGAKSPTAISLSECYHYQYSSICDAVNALHEQKRYAEKDRPQARLELERKLLGLKKDYLAKPFDKFYLLNTDSSPLVRPHSPIPVRRILHLRRSGRSNSVVSTLIYHSTINPILGTTVPVASLMVFKR